MAVGLVLNRRRQVPAEETPAFGAIAERFRRGGDLERAVALCEEGLQKFPDHLSARVTLGWALLDLGRYDEAQVALEQVLKRAPDNLAAIRGLAELHQRAESTVELSLEGPGAWPPDAAAIEAAGAAPKPVEARPVPPPVQKAARPIESPARHAPIRQPDSQPDDEATTEIAVPGPAVAAAADAEPVLDLAGLDLGTLAQLPDFSATGIPDSVAAAPSPEDLSPNLDACVDTMADDAQLWESLRIADPLAGRHSDPKDATAVAPLLSSPSVASQTGPSFEPVLDDFVPAHDAETISFAAPSVLPAVDLGDGSAGLDDSIVLSADGLDIDPVAPVPFESLLVDAGSRLPDQPVDDDVVLSLDAGQAADDLRDSSPFAVADGDAATAAPHELIATTFESAGIEPVIDDELPAETSLFAAASSPAELSEAVSGFAFESDPIVHAPADVAAEPPMASSAAIEFVDAPEPLAVAEPDLAAVAAPPSDVSLQRITNLAGRPVEPLLDLELQKPALESSTILPLELVPLDVTPFEVSSAETIEELSSASFAPLAVEQREASPEIVAALEVVSPVAPPPESFDAAPPEAGAISPEADEDADIEDLDAFVLTPAPWELAPIAGDGASADDLSGFDFQTSAERSPDNLLFDFETMPPAPVAPAAAEPPVIEIAARIPIFETSAAAVPLFTSPAPVEVRRPVVFAAPVPAPLLVIPAGGPLSVDAMLPDLSASPTLELPLLPPEAAAIRLRLAQPPSVDILEGMLRGIAIRRSQVAAQDNHVS